MNILSICKRALGTLVALLFVFGCTNDVDKGLPPQDDLHEIVFHAGWDPETKTVLQEDLSIWWEPGDEISLFVRSDNGGYKLTSTNIEPSAKVDFAGEIGEKAENASYIAVYPYDETTVCNNGVGDDDGISVILPSVQIARENDLPEKTFKSFAVSDNETLFFKNLFGGIKLSVSRPDIKSITVRSIAMPYSGKLGDALSGRFSYNIRGELRSSSGSDRVTLIAPDNGCFSPEKYYYVVLPARELEYGLVVTFKTESSEASAIYNEGKTISTSKFKRLYKADEGLEFHDSHSTYARFTYSNIIPSTIDRNSITEMHFHTSSDKTTENALYYTDPYGEPVYYEIDGTVINYYTKAEVYQVTERNGNSMFSGLLNLESLDLSSFDVSACTDFTSMFSGDLKLKDLRFGDFNTSNAQSMSYMFGDCISLESIDLSGFNTSNVQNMNYMFLHCYSLKELDLSHFDTHNVTQMGEVFECCYRLEKLDISSFSSDKLEYAPALFCYCYSLLKLDMGSFDLSKLPGTPALLCYNLAKRSRNCAVLCTTSTKEVMMSHEAGLMGCADYIQWFTPGETLPDLSMNYNPELYYSTDYSKDKAVKMLNVATEGKGINVVIIGEAYSDRLIDDGTYERDMYSAMEQLFSVEPFKSFRHLFNVYMVTAVSENEVVCEFTALRYYCNNWTDEFDRDDIAINEYVSQAVGRDENREVTTLVVVNSDESIGSCAMVNGSTSDEDHYDYPAKIIGVAFACKATEHERYKYLFCHEFGHAFAALHDEYVNKTGEMETWESDFKKYYQAHLGWWANVAFTSDPSLVGWSPFLTPGSGYDETEVSVIEGALYSQGIWKSVDQSMMNVGGEYSVPAREAIYKKIHKVAYGEEWQYSFDDFVTWDRKAIPPATRAKLSPLKPNAIGGRHPKPFFKMEESTAPDGRREVTVIMD